MELCLVILLSLVNLDTVIAGNCPSNCKSTTCNDEDSGCPECETAYWGRHCQYPMECVSSSTGVEYRGTRNTTQTGKVCQAWNSQTPHAHSNTHFPSNYCRHKGNNPDFPWCYTMDRNTRAEKCSIQQCNLHCKSPDFNVGFDVVSPPRNGFTPGLELDVIIPCEAGYTAPSGSNITCQINTLEWTAWPKCERVKCQKPIIDNAVVPMQAEYLFEDTIQIKCNKGYILEGNSTTCQADMTWTYLPSCKGVECPVPSLNTHSLIVNTTEGQRFTYQDVMTLGCEIGYVVQGQSSLVCLANKTWSDTPPTCIRAKCQKPVIDNAVMPTQAEYMYNDTIHIECNTGYELEGGSTTICQANTAWSSLPSCKGVECPVPTLNNHSFIVNATEGQTFTYTDDMTVSCDIGYVVQGQPSLVCLSNKTWSGTLPTCIRAKCKKPVIDNAVLPIQAEYMYNDTMHIECNTGYELEGSSTTICQANTAWSSLPSCKGVECTIPTLNNHSFIVNATEGQTFTYQDVMTVSCETGYVVQGQISFVCLANKTWSDTMPNCMIQKCQQPDLSGKNLYIHSLKEEYIYEDVIIVSCDSGNVTNSSDAYVCQSDGTWGREFPTCKHTEESFLTMEVIIGIAVGGFAFVCILIVVSILLCRRRRVLKEWEQDYDQPNSKNDAKEMQEYENTTLGYL